MRPYTLRCLTGLFFVEAGGHGSPTNEAGVSAGMTRQRRSVGGRDGDFNGNFELWLALITAKISSNPTAISIESWAALGRLVAAEHCSLRGLCGGTQSMKMCPDDEARTWRALTRWLHLWRWEVSRQIRVRWREKGWQTVVCAALYTVGSTRIWIGMSSFACYAYSIHIFSGRMHACDLRRLLPIESSRGQSLCELELSKLTMEDSFENTLYFVMSRNSQTVPDKSKTEARGVPGAS